MAKQMKQTAAQPEQVLTFCVENCTLSLKEIADSLNEGKDLKAIKVWKNLERGGDVVVSLPV